MLKDLEINKEICNFAPVMQENRGRKRKNNYDLVVDKVEMIPLDSNNPTKHAALIRSAYWKFIQRNNPKWKFTSCIVDGNLLIKRIK